MHSVAFSPDDRLLAAANGDAEVFLWNVASGALLRTLADGQRQRGWSVAFSPDGRMLASVAAGGTLALWDLTARQYRARELKMPTRVVGIACLSDGTLVSACGDGSVQRWEPAGGRDPRLLAALGRGTGLAVDAHGRRLAIGQYGSEFVRIWDLVRTVELLVFPTGERRLARLAIAADGTTVVTAGWDAPTRFWDMTTGRLLGELSSEEADPATFALAPSGGFLWTRCGGTDRISRYPSGEVIYRRPEGASDLATFDADARFLALARRNSLYLWDLDEATPRPPLPGHRATITSLAFSPDRKTLVSASSDGVVKLWHVATGQELLTLTGHGGVDCVAFSPDGQLLATGGVGLDGRGQVLLWDAPRETARE